MKERMVSFNREMVVAILAGRKDVTRRPVQFGVSAHPGGWPFAHEQPDGKWAFANVPMNATNQALYEGKGLFCPIGQPGDVILVRETARVHRIDAIKGRKRVTLQYEADGELSAALDWPARIKPIAVGKCIPNGVFKEGARLRLEIVSVRVERVQDITEEDVRREGFDCVSKDGKMYKYGIAEKDGLPGETGWPWVEWDKDFKKAFGKLWTSVYRDSWTRNDWVWRVEFKRAT